MGKLLLYAYTTETYLKDGRIKVGHTKVEIGEERIWNQFGTSNPENPIYQIIGELPDGVQDHSIHKQLIKNGCRKIEDVPGQEWFKAKNTSDPFKDVRQAYNEIVNNCSRTEHYKLRKEQAGAVEKASKWFNKEYPQLLGNIKMKRTVSCGCRLRETWKEAKKHGLNGTSTYTTWENMHNRCNSKNKQCKGLYKNIEVCESWKDFMVFYQDMGERPIGTSLDRIDNTKGYSKDNCRWATRKEQQSNISSNVWIEYKNQKNVISEWSRILHIPLTTIIGRMKRTKDPNIILHKGPLKKGALKCQQKS